VFWVGALVCLLSFFISFSLPKKGGEGSEEPIHSTESDVGETMLMAEQTTINARNQPKSSRE
jgi:hypothetical protein